MTDCNEEERGSFATVIASAITLAIIVIAFGCRPYELVAFATPTPTAASTPTLTPTLTPTSTPTPTFTPMPTPTLTSTPTTAPALNAPQDHYWLAYPLADRQRRVSRYYPYGSTAGGELQLHHGVDIQSPTGTPILAVAEGTVIVAGDDHSKAYGPTTDFYGNLVIVRLDRDFHGQPVFCLYGHLSRVIARVGQRVKPGDVLGEVGETGVAMGPHLHFEVRVGGNTYADTRNPELWLEPLPGHGTIAGKVLGADGEPIPEALITFHRAEAPDERWREAWTYPAYEVNPDEDWGENFAMGDVPVGTYILRVRIGGMIYTREVEVLEGETSFVVIQGVK